MVDFYGKAFPHPLAENIIMSGASTTQAQWLGNAMQAAHHVTYNHSQDCLNTAFRGLVL